MSFSTVASYPIGKSAELFGQCYEELNHEFFDQFLDLNDNESIGYTNLQTAIFPEAPTVGKGSECTSLTSSDDEGKAHYLYPGGFGEASSSYSAQNHVYAELSGRAAISDSELLSLEGINFKFSHVPQHSQHSPPCSPSSVVATSFKRQNRTTEILTMPIRRASSNFDKALLRSPIRKASASPKMRAAHQSQVGIDGWGQKLEQDAAKFGYDLHEDSQKFMTPLSGRNLSSIPHAMSLKKEMTDSLNDNCNMLHQASGPYHTPLSTPLLDGQHSRKTSVHSLPSSSPLFPLTPQNPNTAGLWSQLPSSPPLSADQTIGGYSDSEQPLWWNHAATAKIAQPAPSVYHNNPQRATKTLAMQLQNGLSYNSNELSFDPSAMNNGLMIQMPCSGSQEALGMDSPSMQQGYFDVARPQPRSGATARRFAPVRLRVPQYTNNAGGKQHHSISNDSGISLAESHSPYTTNVRKRRSSKDNKHSTPRALSLASAVDFVNFTPGDSKKILTGVAPSGSSKTKARREKEAMEKRRKLSQAAMRAIRAAGGDVESLVGEGLFV